MSGSNSILSLLRGLSCKSYTLNFDGSHNNQANKSGAGCIIRDDQGEFKLAAAYCLTESYADYCNVAIAEAKALLNGLKLAKENNLSIGIIRGDSTEVIDYVLKRSQRPPKPPLDDIINQIIGMIEVSSQTIEVIDREANQVADKLAFWGCNKLLRGHKLEVYTSYTDLPTQVAELIKEEKLCKKMKEVDNGEGSSMGSTLLKAGLATVAVGAAMFVSKFMESSSDDQQYGKKYENSPRSYTMNAQNYTNKSFQLGSSNSMLRESSYGYDDDEYAPVNYAMDTNNNDFYKLNFDGSDINQLRKGGAGCIIRNREGDLVIAAAYNLNKLYPNQLNVAIAEAMALKNGLKLAKSLNVKLNLIEGDSLEVIDRVLGRERKPPRIPFLNEIISEIKVALVYQSIDIYTQLKLIERDANKVADELATIGSGLESGTEKTYAKDDVLTFKLAQLIGKDKLAKGIYK